MKSKRITKKAEGVEAAVAPQSIEEADQWLAQIAEEQRMIQSVEADLNQKIDALKTEAVMEVATHEKKLDELVEGLYAFAEPRRKELTEDGKKKLVQLPTGVFGWQKSPPMVVISDTEAVIKCLQKMKLEKFLRIKPPEIDKAAMLKESDLAKTVKGVSFIEVEDFVMKPAGVKLTRRGERLKRKKP